MNDNLKEKKSRELNGIHPRMIQELKRDIVDLTKICNIIKFSFPTSGLKACKDDANVQKNYLEGIRKLQATSVPRKLVESAIKPRNHM